MKKFVLQIVYVLIFLSLLLTGMGGWMDWTGIERMCGISKVHAWHDGMYLLLLAVTVVILANVRSQISSHNM